MGPKAGRFIFRTEFHSTQLLWHKKENSTRVNLDLLHCSCKNATSLLSSVMILIWILNLPHKATVDKKNNYDVTTGWELCFKKITFQLDRFWAKAANGSSSRGDHPKTWGGGAPYPTRTPWVAFGIGHRWIHHTYWRTCPIIEGKPTPSEKLDCS